MKCYQKKETEADKVGGWSLQKGWPSVFTCNEFSLLLLLFFSESQQKQERGT